MSMTWYYQFENINVEEQEGSGSANKSLQIWIREAQQETDTSGLTERLKQLTRWKIFILSHLLNLRDWGPRRPGTPPASHVSRWAGSPRSRRWKPHHSGPCRSRSTDSIHALHINHLCSKMMDPDQQQSRTLCRIRNCFQDSGWGIFFFYIARKTKVSVFLSRQSVSRIKDIMKITEISVSQDHHGHDGHHNIRGIPGTMDIIIVNDIPASRTSHYKANRGHLPGHYGHHGHYSHHEHHSHPRQTRICRTS